MSQLRTLRPHQERALDLLKQSILDGKKRPLIQLATGGGKTLLATHVVAGAIAKRKRVVFTVPAISLIDQTAHAFYADGIRGIGVIQGDHPMTNVNAPVQVASVQTLARRQLPEADIIVVDEAHQCHKIIFDWMEQRPDALFIGLSATPWAKGLGKHYSNLLVAATTPELIDAGFLSPYLYYEPSKPDLSGVAIRRGDYVEGQLSEVMSGTAITADVVSTWLKLGEGRPTVVFCVDRAHARKVAEQFARANVSVEYADAHTPRAERTAIGKRLESGETKVVCNVGIFATGTDWPFIGCVILARPSKSEMLLEQIRGRGLRTYPGKANCIFLDHAGAGDEIGYPGEIHYTELDDGTRKEPPKQVRKKREKLPANCTSCGNLRPTNVHECTHCGFAPEKQSTVETLVGELVQVKGKKPVYDHDTKQRWYSMLLWHCNERGYKPGWAANQYRQKFGVWPRGLVEALQRPDGEVERFVRSRQIAFAKRRDREASHAA